MYFYYDDEYLIVNEVILALAMLRRIDLYQVVILRGILQYSLLIQIKLYQRKA